MQEYEAASAQIIGFQNLPRASRLGLNVWLLDEQGNGVVAGGLGLPLFSVSGYLHNGPESYHLWPFEEFNRNIVCFEQNHEMRVDLEHGPSIDESKMPEDAHDSFLMRQPSDDEPRRASTKKVNFAAATLLRSNELKKAESHNFGVVLSFANFGDSQMRWTLSRSKDYDKESNYMLDNKVMLEEQKNEIDSMSEILKEHGPNQQTSMLKSLVL